MEILLVVLLSTLVGLVVHAWLRADPARTWEPGWKKRRRRRRRHQRSSGGLEAAMRIEPGPSSRDPRVWPARGDSRAGEPCTGAPSGAQRSVQV